MLKHTSDSVDVITRAPPTGIWQMDAHGTVSYARYDTHRYHVESESEALFIRIAGAGDYWYKGADLGILVTRGRLMTDGFELNERARAWFKGIKSHFQSIHSSQTSVAHLAPGAYQARPVPASSKLL